jgi:hypothetical protein
VKRAVLVALLLAAAPLVAACGADPTCDDVASLEQQLAETDVDDPSYNDIVNDLQRAEADCSS